MEFSPLANILLMVALLFGIILTLIGLPGNFLLLLAAAIYGWQEEFLHLNYAWLLLLTAMWGCGELLEFLAGIMGAKKQRASGWALLAAFFGSLAGGIVGTGMLPLIGTVLGALFGGFIASYTAEYFYTKDKEKAHAVAQGVVKGQITGMLIKLVIAISMAGAILYKIWG